MDYAKTALNAMLLEALQREALARIEVLALRQECDMLRAQIEAQPTKKDRKS